MSTGRSTGSRNSCLKLVLPKSLEEQVVDLLLGHPEWVGGFVTQHADGHGAPGSIASPAEQVRGRAERTVMEILVDADHARELVRHLQSELPNADIAWWLLPVLDAGSFA